MLKTYRPTKEPSPEAAPAREMARTGSSQSVRLLGAALGTAVLLWLSHFPVVWGFLAWIALVPLLVLVRTTIRPLWVYLFAWGSGLAFFLPAISWMRVADPRMYYTWAALSLYCSLYFPVAIFLLRRLDAQTPLPVLVTVPVVWTALELLRTHLLSGFAWYYLSHTQHNFLPAIQISDITGAYGVTFVLVTVNALLFELLSRFSRLRAWFYLREAGPCRWRLGLQVEGVVLLVAATLGYGWARLSQEEFTAGPKLALIQGNLDQRLRNLAMSTDGERDKAAEIMAQHFIALSDQAATLGPDLIVWPETSYPGWWKEVPPGQPSLDSLQLARDSGKRWRTNALLGLNSSTQEQGQKEKSYNSAVLLRKDGQPAGRYDKMHRVPFGEFVPLRDWVPWLDRFAPYDFDYGIEAGERFTRFSLGSFSFGVLICYEDTDPALARPYGREYDGQAPVDFLINISNDGWFDGSAEHEEHLAICRFRAVESRRAVARAVNMGISAVVDGSGRVVALPAPTWEQSKKIDVVLTATIPIDHRTSFYSQHGDWLPWACWLVIAGGLVVSWVRKPVRSKT